MNFFDVNTVAWTLWGHNLSWIELVGTIFNLASVWLMARNRILSWPVGIVGGVLFLVLFWQVRLYSDFFEQIYYIVTNFWGWWLWQKSGAPNEGPVKRNTQQENVIAIATTAVFSLLLGWATSQLHPLFPKLFPETASYAYLDAATTVASIVAQILMVQRRFECWIFWIIIDVAGVWLYWQKDLVFLTGLYAIFLVLATLGLIKWHKNLREQLAA